MNRSASIPRTALRFICATTWRRATFSAAVTAVFYLALAAALHRPPMWPALIIGIVTGFLTLFILDWRTH